MVNTTLTRNEYTDQGTFGVLKVKGKAFAIVELPWRGNKDNVSCIPEGVYQCVYEYSDKFKMKLYEIKGVPGRSECKFHYGNYAGDKKMGYRSDSNGCPIIGRRKVKITGQFGVDLSRMSLIEFHNLMDGEEMTLTIQNKKGVEHE